MRAIAILIGLHACCCIIRDFHPRQLYSRVPEDRTLLRTDRKLYPGRGYIAREALGGRALCTSLNIMKLLLIGGILCSTVCFVKL